MILHQMKAHRFLRPLPLLASVLILAAPVISPAFAQTQATVLPDDASKFPPLNQLPGKPPPYVWDGLAGLWSRRHNTWKATATNDAGSVVFLGDSITQGWNTLARDFPKLKVANRGISGDISSGVLYRLKADVLSLNPVAVILLIGTNDLGDGEDADDVAGNIKLILQAIQAGNPKIKVIVCKTMPRAERDGAEFKPVYAGKIQRVNSLVEDFVKTQPEFAICDTWGAFADDKGNPNPGEFNPDHLHLNPAGYEVWRKTLDPVLVKMNLETAH